jgi:hypothetical protein
MIFTRKPVRTKVMPPLEDRCPNCMEIESEFYKLIVARGYLCFRCTSYPEDKDIPKVDLEKLKRMDAEMLNARGEN